MADLDLNELERLEKAATPGPWEGPWGDTHTVAAFEGELNEHSLTNDPRGDAFPVTQETQPNDAALIAALRNALPELLRRLRAAEADAERYRWLMENATRMSEPLYARGTKASPICGHRVSLIVSFDGDYRSTPWATQETFTAAIDAARGRK